MAMKQLYRIFFSVLNAGLEGRELDGGTAEAITPDILRKLYSLAKHHDMAHIVAKPLLSLKLEGCEEIKAKLSKQELLAVFRHEQLRYELERIKETLEKAGIDFIALKGSRIRDLYREPYFRTSCDIDVLVHEEELDGAIASLTDAGYTVKGEKSYHDISLFSEGGVHLELHFNICEKQESLDRLLSRAWDFAERAGESETHEFIFSDEFFIFHLVAHAAYHFTAGGCGVKPLMDIWTLDKKLDYDKEKVRELCAECGIEKFYDALCRLSRVWFDREESDALLENMEDYILKAGVYGNTENKVAVAQNRGKGGKLGYLFRRIFIPYDDLKYYYPVLQKHKWLLPVMEVRRWFRLVFCGGFKKSVKELKTGVSMSDQRSASIEGLMKELKL